MIKKVALVFAILALAVASAETFKVKLFQPCVVQGTELKPGEYTLDLKADKLVMASGKQSVETAVKVETSGTKFNQTVVRYATAEGKLAIQEIRVGGTKTKLVFTP
jgi:hypothetical protein